MWVSLCPQSGFFQLHCLWFLLDFYWVTFCDCCQTSVNWDESHLSPSESPTKAWFSFCKPFLSPLLLLLSLSLTTFTIIMYYQLRYNFSWCGKFRFDDWKFLVSSLLTFHNPCFIHSFIHCIPICHSFDSRFIAITFIPYKLSSVICWLLKAPR